MRPLRGGSPGWSRVDGRLYLWPSCPVTDTPPLNIHASCVALSVDGAWRGVLLRGPSGAGKSDLAIRLIEGGARLVADDRTDLMPEGHDLVARPPAVLSGLIEVRGIGILRLHADQVLAAAPVALIVDLVPATAVERMPETLFETLCGVRIPLCQLTAFEASTPAKIRLALGASRAS